MQFHKSQQFCIVITCYAHTVSVVHDLLPLILNPQISHNLETSEQNFMKLKLYFKQTTATSAGDINSPNLLVNLNFVKTLILSNLKFIISGRKKGILNIRKHISDIKIISSWLKMKSILFKLSKSGNLEFLARFCLRGNIHSLLV